ncbi:pyridoxal-phosphate dependent enzyme [Verrucomicrobiales bacterium BCK34]|nr:pyridoxal-phosphate dependent enzyme [Verrucomicrobiales bacterium BCK34]
MSIWRFANRLANLAEEHQLTLGEGNTPLVRSRVIGPELGLEHLYFKLESVNPTGSYKDRFAAGAVSHLLAKNRTLCLGTSSGNTGAALAGYAAAAGMRCVLAIVEGAPEAKLRQMQAYGAELIRIRGFGADPEVTREVANQLRRLAGSLNTELQISAFAFSPNGMAGVQSIAWELVEQLPAGIDHVFAPAGGGGLVLATARGFSGKQTAVHCVQPEGNDTIAGPLREGLERARTCECTTTVSGLQVASVIDGNKAVAACRASGGTGFLVSDDEVFQMQTRLARNEGVFSEPAGAVSVAALSQALAEGNIHKGETVVCLITGSGFKDATSVARMTSDKDCPLVDDFADFESLVRSS